MKIILTPDESLNMFHSALCNAWGTGYMDGYGLRLTWEQNEYNRSRDKLTNPALEDVLKQMLLDGYSLTMVDEEGEGEYTRTITLKDVEEKMSKVPLSDLSDMINEEDDAGTADVILQTIFFNEIVFG